MRQRPEGLGPAAKDQERLARLGEGYGPAASDCDVDRTGLIQTIRAGARPDEDDQGRIAQSAVQRRYAGLAIQNGRDVGANGALRSAAGMGAP